MYSNRSSHLGFYRRAVADDPPSGGLHCRAASDDDGGDACAVGGAGPSGGWPARAGRSRRGRRATGVSAAGALKQRDTFYSEEVGRGSRSRLRRRVPPPPRVFFHASRGNDNGDVAVEGELAREDDDGGEGGQLRRREIRTGADRIAHDLRAPKRQKPQLSSSFSLFSFSIAPLCTGSHFSSHVYRKKSSVTGSSLLILY